MRASLSLSVCAWFEYPRSHENHDVVWVYVVLFWSPWYFHQKNPWEMMDRLSAAIEWQLELQRTIQKVKVDSRETDNKRKEGETQKKEWKVLNDWRLNENWYYLVSTCVCVCVSVSAYSNWLMDIEVPILCNSSKCKNFVARSHWILQQNSQCGCP